MWLFGKSNEVKKKLIVPGFVDWHSHILPGVDDGVQTIEEALAILALYERMGVAEVWLTPHVMEDIPNTTERLLVRFEELRAAYEGTILLHLGAEYMIDNLFESRFEDDDLLPIGETALLVETSYFNPPMDLHNMLQRIKGKGYVPVLAHPERYLYMEHADYCQLKDMGVAYQLNVSSFAGLYGKHVRQKAEWLKCNGFYDYMGTDIHNKRMIEQSLK